MPTVMCLETLHKRIQSANMDRVWVGAVQQQDGNAGWKVVLKWGRRGTKGSPPREYHFTSFEAARASWKKRVQAQMDDGYQPVDWQDGAYGMRTFVKSLGSLEGLSGSNAPAAVTQKPAAPSVWSNLSNTIWGHAQKGKSVSEIAVLLSMTYLDVLAVFEARLHDEKLAWTAGGMLPHHAIVGKGQHDSKGTPVCGVCYTPMQGMLHIAYLKANPHPFALRPNFASLCYCGKTADAVLHTAPLTKPKPKAPVVGDLVVSPPEPAPTPPPPAPAPTPVHIESEAHKERAPIVIPNRRRERTPRGAL